MTTLGKIAQLLIDLGLDSSTADTIVFTAIDCLRAIRYIIAVYYG